MTEEKLKQVQEIWDKANRIVSLSRTIGLGDEERMDGLTIGDMILLMEYVVALGKQRDDLELTLEGVMWNVDKWLEDKELEQDPVNRAITMREKTLNIVETMPQKIFSELELNSDIMQTPNGICMFIKADNYTNIKKK